MTFVLRQLLALYAPFLPFVADELHHALYAPHEQATSIHLTSWPQPSNEDAAPCDIKPILAVLRTARAIRTERRIPQSQEVATLILNCDPDLMRQLEGLESSLLAASRARVVAHGSGGRETGYTGLRLDLSS